MEKPYYPIDDLGGTHPYFWKHPYIYIFPWASIFNFPRIYIPATTSVVTIVPDGCGRIFGHRRHWKIILPPAPILGSAKSRHGFFKLGGNNVVQKIEIKKNTVYSIHITVSLKEETLSPFCWTQIAALGRGNHQYRLLLPNEPWCSSNLEASNPETHTVRRTKERKQKMWHHIARSKIWETLTAVFHKKQPGCFLPSSLLMELTGLPPKPKSLPRHLALQVVALPAPRYID